MRLSIERNDPGYQPPHITDKANIYFNGIALRDCITADEEKGEVTVYTRDPYDNFIIIDDEVQRETVKGEVKIVFTTEGYMQ